jgi:hypothetical protein
VLRKLRNRWGGVRLITRAALVSQREADEDWGK